MPKFNIKNYSIYKRHFLLYVYMCKVCAKVTKDVFLQTRDWI